MPAGRRAERRWPSGWVWLLRFQVGVVYVFAGLAKLQADWLVRASRSALAAGPRRPAGGRPAGGLEAVRPRASRWPARAVRLPIVVPLLLWRRTRLVAWLALVAFHVCTWVLFPIGVFPWLMIGVATVFFEPDWPRRLLARHGPRRPWRCRGVAAVRRSPVLLALAGGVGRGPARPAAAPPRLPRRPPVDRRGLPVRLERAAGREVAAR